MLVGTPGVGAEPARRALHALALRLCESGYLVLRYDPPGAGDSADGPEDGLFRKPSLDAHREALNSALTAVRDSGVARVGAVGMRDGAAAVRWAQHRMHASVLWDPAELSVARPARAGGEPGQTLVLLREGRALSARVRASFDEHTQWGVARGQAELLEPTADQVQLPEPTIGVVAWWLDRELDGELRPVRVAARTRRVVRGPDQVPLVDELVAVGEVAAVRTSLVGPATGPTVLFTAGPRWGRAGPHRTWLPLSRRVAAAGRPVLRLDLLDDGEPALLDLVQSLDLADLVVCGEQAALPSTPQEYRAFARLAAPHRIAVEPVPADPRSWDDRAARARAVETLATALLAHQAPVVDLAALEQLDPDDPAFTEARETLVVAPPPPGRSRARLVTGAVALGLVVQAAGYALGRHGHGGLAEVLFFAGLLTIFTPCAWRLLGAAADRGERLVVAALLGAALVLSLHLLSPGIFTGYDEMLHEGTLWRLGTQHTLFVQNPLLPVSPRYPGLELCTLALHWCTGVPTIVAQFGVILVARLVLVLIIFLFTERLTGSTRAGSVAVVVYAVSPQFYSFNAAYAYQTLALALGGGALYLVLRAVDARGRQRARALWIAMLCTAGTVVTHHLVGAVTVGALAMWWAAMSLAGRREQLRTVRAAALFGLGFGALWTGVNATALYAYLQPILGSALSGVLGLLGFNSESRRALFQASNGIPTPAWQKLLLLGSTAVVLALLALGIRAALRNRAKTGRPLLRGGRLRFLVLLVAASYLIVLGTRLSGSAAQLGGRASTFVFFGVAPVVGAWFVARTPAVRTTVATLVAALTFLGGVLFGAASWTYLPGPYLPGADERSIDAYAMDAAHWVAGHVPIGSAIADDHDNGALMGDLGHVDPVTEGAPGGVNVGPLYFDQTWSSYDTTLVRTAGIRYLVVDRRLADGPPAYGVYFEAGETQGPEHLTPAQLTKFDTVPGITAVYRHGPITIYDLTGILGPVSAHVSTADQRSSPAALAGLTHTNWLLVVAATLVAGAWLVRARRHGTTADRLLDVALVGTGAAILLAAVVVETAAPPAVTGALVLSILAAAGAAGRPRAGSRSPSAHAIRLRLSSLRRTPSALR